MIEPIKPIEPKRADGEVPAGTIEVTVPRLGFGLVYHAILAVLAFGAITGAVREGWFTALGWALATLWFMAYAYSERNRVGLLIAANALVRAARRFAPSETALIAATAEELRPRGGG